MSIGDWILVCLAMIGVIPIAVIAMESFAALLPGRRRADDGQPHPRCAVLVPAHNEEIGIAQTLNALSSELRQGDRIVVIADNCTDRTAEVARQAGVEAIERSDSERRGKGYALAFGLNHLESDPPEVVILIDADTRTLPGAIDELVRTAAATNQPVQGVFTDAARQAGPREQWSAFALTFKNLVRPLGLHRLGLPCLLTGSGMAFPWQVIRKVELGTGNIVEDMQLGIDLAIAGHPPRFCPDARFESDDAPSIDAAAKPPNALGAWARVHAAHPSSPAFFTGLIQFRPRLMALALELCVPPLSLLFVIHAFLLIVCVTSWQFAGLSWLPAMILTCGGILAVVAILTSWLIFGRRLLSPKILCMLPIYVLWKVPIYLKLITAPQKKWVRTDRNPAA